MSYATVAKLGAGSVFEFEDPQNPGVWTEVPDMLEIGEVGEQGEFVQTTPISKVVHEYIKGMQTPPNKTFRTNHILGEAGQKLFFDRWRDPTTSSMNIRVSYPSNDRASFAVVPNGNVMDSPTNTAQQQMMYFAQQTGSTSWSEL